MIDDTDYGKLRQLILCQEVCEDLLIAYFFDEKTKNSVDQFFETLPNMTLAGEKLEKWETARLLLPGFLKEFVSNSVEYHTKPLDLEDEEEEETP